MNSNAILLLMIGTILISLSYTGRLQKVWAALTGD